MVRVSPLRSTPAVVLIAVALAAGCGDSDTPARPVLSTPDAQQGIVYGKLPPDPPTGITPPFTTRGCQGCPPGTATPEAAGLAPGAQRIAFTRATAADEADIWIAAADGSGEVRLTRDAGLEMSPTWSPDAAAIAFVSDRAGGNLDLYTIAHRRRRCRAPDRLAGRRVLAGLVARRPHDRRHAARRTAMPDVVLVDAGTARRSGRSLARLSGRAGCPTRAGCS